MSTLIDATLNTAKKKYIYFKLVARGASLLVNFKILALFPPSTNNYACPEIPNDDQIYL